MKEDTPSDFPKNDLPSHELKCKNCGAHKECLNISCTKPGMFVSYFHIICQTCGYEYDDRWIDELL